MEALNRATPQPAPPLRQHARVLARLPLLILGFASLVVGVAAGLARAGWLVPAVAQTAAPVHAPLMIGGFLGVVIALERAVALGRPAAYLGPLCAGVGAAAAIAQRPVFAAMAMSAASAVLLATTLAVWRRQRAPSNATLALGAAAWLVGNALWLAGRPLPEAVPWWLSFPILTIAGERLELTRFMPPSTGARRLFVGIVGLIVLGLALGAAGMGVVVWGAGLLALAIWLFGNDIARRTVTSRGLTRFCAVALLSGYAWLALAGVVVVAAGSLDPGSRAHDAAVHALALGFVFSMILAHAPIVLPAVLRVAVPYHPVAYVPLVLLHGSVALRAAGDAIADGRVARAGALLNALALAAFVALTLATVLRARRAR